MKTIGDTDVLTSAEREMLSEVKRIVLDRLPDSRVMLYGSAARGEHGAESDYDIVAVHTRQLTWSEQVEVSEAVYDLELERGVVISLMLYGVDEWNAPLMCVSPYHKAVEREGIVL